MYRIKSNYTARRSNSSSHTFLSCAYTSTNQNQTCDKEKVYQTISLLWAVLTLTGLMLFSFEAFVNPDIYSPLALFLNVYLWLRLSTIINTCYWVANLTREIISRYLSRGRSNKSGTLCVTKPVSLSFLIPAYNEEKPVGGCIESIDREVQTTRAKLK